MMRDEGLDKRMSLENDIQKMVNDSGMTFHFNQKDGADKALRQKPFKKIFNNTSLLPKLN
jgi:hypothetical protein